MKDTILTRLMDDLGRVIIPKLLRQSIGIDSNDCYGKGFYITKFSDKTLMLTRTEKDILSVEDLKNRIGKPVYMAIKGIGTWVIIKSVGSEDLRGTRIDFVNVVDTSYIIYPNDVSENKIIFTDYEY